MSFLWQTTCVKFWHQSFPRILNLHFAKKKKRKEKQSIQSLFSTREIELCMKKLHLITHINYRAVSHHAYQFYIHKQHPHIHVPHYVCKYANHLQLTPTGRVNDGYTITFTSDYDITDRRKEKRSISCCVSCCLQSELDLLLFTLWLQAVVSEDALQYWPTSSVTTGALCGWKCRQLSCGFRGN